MLQDIELEKILRKLKNTKVVQKNTAAGRFYEIHLKYDILKLESTTSLLSKFKSDKDRQGLINWRNNVGHEEADRISETSLKRGTVMHDCLDFYFEEYNLLESMKKSAEKNKNISENFIKQGQNLFYQIYRSGIIKNVSLSLLREFKIFNYWKLPDTSIDVGYSGTLDHFCYFNDNKFKVIDYKNSIKLKKLEYVKDYITQVAMYVKALQFMSGNNPIFDNMEGEIWISCEDKNVQRFQLNSQIIEREFNKVKEKINDYYSKKLY